MKKTTYKLNQGARKREEFMSFICGKDELARLRFFLPSSLSSLVVVARIGFLAIIEVH